MGYSPEANRCRPPDARAGAVAANIHGGEGLTYAPFVKDIESLEVVLADGSVVECSAVRATMSLFRLIVGGYGLFGVVTSVKLRLVPRQKVERVVELARVEHDHRALSRANRRRLSVRRLPVLERAGGSRLPVSRRVFLLSAGGSRYADSARSDSVVAGRLAPAAVSRSSQQAAGVQ